MYHMCSQDDHPGPLRHGPVLSWTEPSAHLTPGAFSFLIRVSGGVGHAAAVARHALAPLFRLLPSAVGADGDPDPARRQHRHLRTIRPVQDPPSGALTDAIELAPLEKRQNLIVVRDRERPI